MPAHLAQNCKNMQHKLGQSSKPADFLQINKGHGELDAADSLLWPITAMSFPLAVHNLLSP